MKKLVLPLFAATSLFMVSCGAEEATTETTTETETETIEPVLATYNVAEGSSLTWTGYEKADEAGHYHKGTAPYSGTIETTDGEISGGTITIDLGNLGFIKGLSHGNELSGDDSTSYAGLFDHFNAPDMFDIANNPTATLTLAGYNKDNDCIDATLNVKGVDVAIAIPHNAIVDDAEIAYTNSFDVDLGSAIPFFAIPPVEEGAEPLTEAPMALRIGLDLKATK